MNLQNLPARGTWRAERGSEKGCVERGEKGEGGRNEQLALR